MVCCKLMFEINVVLYIDVMLVLLVIFMVMVLLLIQGVQVDLLNVLLEVIFDNVEDLLVILICSDGVIFVNLGIQNFDDEGIWVIIYSLLVIWDFYLLVLG